MKKQYRFVSWAAVSSLPQAEKISLSEQREINLQHIQKFEGKLVADLVVDESRDIPELSEACERIEAYRVLRDLIKSGGCDVVICYTRSRLGRVAALVETIAELCRRAAIIIYETDSPPGSLEGNGNTVDLLTGMVRSWGAQREVDELRHRNKMGMVGRILRGEFPHKAPWGWKEKHGSDGKRFHVIEPDAKVALELIITLYLENGWGAAGIADELTNRGIPAPKGGKWNKVSVQQVIRRIWLFAGYTSINRESITGRPFTQHKGNFPALISEEVAAKVAAEQERRVKARRSVGTTHLFSQCVWCEICGKYMIAGWARRKTAKGEAETERFDCLGKHAGRQIRAKLIHAAVEEAIIFAQSKANRQKILESTINAAPSVEDDIALVNRKIAELSRNLERADDAYVSGSMSQPRFERQVKHIAEEIAGYEDRLKQLKGTMQEREHALLLSQRLEEIAKEGLGMLAYPDIPLANTWIRNHFKVVINSGQVVKVVYL